MTETLKCPHCGAVYEVIYNRDISGDEHAADCQICGKQMVLPTGARIPHYELVKMPDGTDV